MAAYLVLSPKGAKAHDPDSRFVKDGFSWLAALFPVFWALAQSLYFDTVGLLVLRVAGWMMLADARFSEIGLSILAVTSLIYGFEARNRYANRLADRGFRLQTIVSARDIDEAEEIFYADKDASPSTDPVFKFDPDFSGKSPVASQQAPTALGMINFERGRR
jgi:hypothetical protein